MKSNKILVGYMIGDNNSGVDKFIENFIKNVSSQYPEIKLGVLTSNTITPYLQTLIEQYKIEVYIVPSLKNIPKQISAIKKIIKEHDYDTTYFNISECSNIGGIIAAHLCGVKKRIVHSHSSSIVINGMKSRVLLCIHHVMKPFLHKFCNKYVACSRKAAQWLFPKHIVEENKVIYFFNFVDVNKFSYKEEKRIEARSQLNLTDELVVGHVANFNPVKNHLFLLEVVKEILAIKPNTKLFLVGDGDERTNIEAKIKELDIASHVTLLGIRRDVNELIQAFDIMILPSFFEGLPIAPIEGQVAGLDCFLSDTITTEAKITDHCHFISLKQPSSHWAQYILSHLNMRQNYNLETFKPYDVSNMKKLFDIIIQE